jgi:hypothetical protein
MKNTNIKDTADNVKNLNKSDNASLDTSNNLNDRNNQNVLETNKPKAMETDNPNMTHFRNTDLDNRDKDLLLSSEEEIARVNKYLKRLEELPPTPTHDPNLPVVNEAKEISGAESTLKNPNESTSLVEDVDNTMSDFMSHYFSSSDDDDNEDTMDKSSTRSTDTLDANKPITNNETLFDALVPILSKIVKEDKEEIYKVLKENGILEGVKILTSNEIDSPTSAKIPDELFEEDQRTKDKIIKDLLEEGLLTIEDLKKIKQLLELNQSTMEQAKRAYEF